MNLKIKSESDFWSGLLFAGFGIAAVVIASRYEMGSAVSMGPGYFPVAIGLVLTAVGLVMAITSFKVESEKIDRTVNIRALVSVCAGLLLFGWGIERIGFIPSLTGLVLLGSLAGQTFNWKETLVLTVGIVGGSWLIFIEGLDVPFQLFW